MGAPLCPGATDRAQAQEQDRKEKRQTPFMYSTRQTLRILQRRRMATKHRCLFSPPIIEPLRHNMDVPFSNWIEV